MKGHRLFFSPVYAHVMHPAPLYIFTFTLVVNLMKLSWKCWMSHKLEKKNEIFGYDIFKFKLHCWVKKKTTWQICRYIYTSVKLKKIIIIFCYIAPFLPSYSMWKADSHRLIEWIIGLCLDRFPDWLTCQLAQWRQADCIACWLTSWLTDWLEQSDLLV